MDLAQSIQVVTEEAMLRMARRAHAETGKTNLCLAGGVALNCVANGRILREGPFKEIWIQPAAGDAGGALGAALTVWHQMMDKPRDNHGRDTMRGALLGPEYTDAEIAAYLESVAGVSERLPDLALARKSCRSCLRTEKWSGGFVDGWSLDHAHWVRAALLETRAIRRCSRR